MKTKQKPLNLRQLPTDVIHDVICDACPDTVSVSK